MNKPSFFSVLAPMAGVTDAIYRGICKEMQCDLTVTEMISAKGLHYACKRSAALYGAHPLENTFCIQLFGSEPDIMADVAKYLCEVHEDRLAYIDINMGCPAPKITDNGEGSALMKDPVLAGKITSAVVRASSVPISVKFRKGWDPEHINALSFAHIMQDSGASLITVHGRTRSEFYSGKADWDIIARIKSSLSIPVVGNGDIFCAQDALDMVAYTGCDGVMVGRGAQGNPWIFEEIACARQGIPYQYPSNGEKIRFAIRHLKEHVSAKGLICMPQMRKHLAWYMSGMPGANKMRVKVNGCNNFESLVTLLLEYAQALDNNGEISI